MEADAYILPPDVKLIPIAEVSPALRERLNGSDGDYVLTKVGARANSKAVDARFAGLLEEFREPRTVVAGILAYSQKHGADPESVLDDAYPLLHRFVAEKLLVEASGEPPSAMAPTLVSGQEIDGYGVGSPIQVLEDSEIYRCRGVDGGSCALKIERPEVRASVRERFRNEAAILSYLDGHASPKLQKQGAWNGRHYLITEWKDGIPVAHASAELRHSQDAHRLSRLLALSERVVRAFWSLHQRGVVHGDVHPNNILVGPTGTVSLLDFGEARRIGAGSRRRAGVAFFYEPEYARALRRGRRPPPATPESDQYALGALLYLCLTGRHYRDFALEKAEMLREIEEEGPQPLTVPGRGRWIELEVAIERALSKNPARRYPSLLEFAEALSAVAPTANSSAATGRSPIKVGAPAERFSIRVFGRLGLDSVAGFPGSGAGPTASLDYGAAGVAYAFYRVAGLEEDPALLSLADLWASAACEQCGLDEAFYNEAMHISPASVGRSSLHHTGSGVHFVRALVSHAMGDFVSTQAALDLFVKAGNGPESNPDLTLGRSGIMLGCAHLLDAIPEHQLLSLELLRELGDTIASEVWALIDGPEPCREATDLPFLGVAHGWAGLLWATLEWARVSRRLPPRRCEERLSQLADLAEPAGRGMRWPIRGDSPSGRRGPQHMPGWCNGSAGYVFLWTAANMRFCEERWGQLAEAAAWNAFEDPDRANNLCCGLAGRSYALVNAYRWSGDPCWLDRARNLTADAVAMLPEDGSGSNSLYKGDLGLALLARELEQPGSAAMPAFEPEGWPAEGVSRRDVG